MGTSTYAANTATAHSTRFLEMMAICMWQQQRARVPRQTRSWRFVRRTSTENERHLVPCDQAIGGKRSAEAIHVLSEVCVRDPLEAPVLLQRSVHARHVEGIRG